MNHDLHEKRIAILVTNGFEQVELTEPKKALEHAGARAEIVSPAKGRVKGWKHTERGDEFTVDVPLESANAAQNDGLLLPGGVMNPDKLRRDPKALQFVRAFFMAANRLRPFWHGPWRLIDAGVVQGRRLTYQHEGGDYENQTN